jgi:hypothetical protein
VGEEIDDGRFLGEVTRWRIGARVTAVPMRARTVRVEMAAASTSGCVR